jgi:gamma-glutamyltranspeptidase / glutathione hydrolase
MKPQPDHHGVIAAGHAKTVQAAREILEDGGNAYDAVIAAHLTACVAEPVLSSLAGGGFMLAHTAEGHDVLYDFFVHTPRIRRPENEVEFFPITADFGSTSQEFHIGLGSMAAPGTVPGLFRIHRDLASLPMTRLAEQAIGLARSGVVMNSFQAYILDIVQAVYLEIPGAKEIFGSGTHPGKLITDGELLMQPDLASVLDLISTDGEDTFIRGDIARQISRICRDNGGHLSTEDFSDYKVIRRKPLRLDYRGTRMLTNPPPSSGGILNAFALKLIADIDIGKVRNEQGYLNLLARIQELTSQARVDSGIERYGTGANGGEDIGYTDGDEGPDGNREKNMNRGTERQSGSDPVPNMLDPNFLRKYRDRVFRQPRTSRGTTHISIIDRYGNLASLTTSNGEGCGHILPGTGIMLNNMLGEEDLNPGGFHRWPVNRRMSSMMAPTVLLMPGGKKVTLGSGGSNRLRTAILQVILNIVDFEMPLADAVNHPRIHWERGILSVETGFDAGELQNLVKHYPRHKIWAGKNLFFGGVHAAATGPAGGEGSGDPRRGGSAFYTSSI